MIVLIIFVAIAAVMFILSGNKTAPFAYLEKEKFETEYGVSGMAKERKAQYKDLHTKNNIAETCLCITALIPLFVGAIYARQIVHRKSKALQYRNRRRRQ